MNVAASIAIVLSAQAHVGDLIDTLDAHHTPDGFAVEGAFGLVAERAGQLEWICHETAIVTGSTADAFFDTDGLGRWTSRVVELSSALDGEPLRISDDLCTWQVVPGFSGRLISVATFGSGGELWVATADPGAPNSVFRGPFGGELDEALTLPDARVLSLEVGAGIWATASRDGVTSVWHSPEGDTWTEVPLQLPPDLAQPIDATIGIADPTDPTAAWLVLDPIGEDRLVRLTDGAQIQQVVWSAPERITDLELAPDGTVYATLGDRRPWRAHPDPVDLEAFADTSGLDAASGLVLAHRTFVNGLLVSTSDDYAVASSVLTPDTIVGPRQCAPDSETATLCEPLWPQLAGRLTPVDTADTADTDFTGETADTGETGASCGCRQGSPTGSPTALLPLAALWLRRRSRSAAR